MRQIAGICNARRLSLLLAIILLHLSIESTKKVSLSREDKKLIAPSPEEEFFKGVSPLPLAEWQPGKRFIAADNKTILIFSQHGLPAEPDSARIGGKTLSFVRTEPKLEPGRIILRDNRFLRRLQLLSI